jgi:hypothetical protein
LKNQRVNPAIRIVFWPSLHAYLIIAALSSRKRKANNGHEVPFTNDSGSSSGGYSLIAMSDFRPPTEAAKRKRLYE